MNDNIDIEIQPGSRLLTTINKRHDHPYISAPRAPFKARMFKVNAGSKVVLPLPPDCAYIRVNSSDLSFMAFDFIEATLPSPLTENVDFDSLEGGFIVNKDSIFDVDNQRILYLYSPLDVYVSVELWKINNF